MVSDEAVAVFAFAAYHSGQKRRSAGRAGNKASDRAIHELRSQALIEADGGEIRFTPSREEGAAGLHYHQYSRQLSYLRRLNRHALQLLPPSPTLARIDIWPDDWAAPLWHCRAHVPSLPISTSG